MARAQADAWSGFLRSLPEVLRARARVQRLRLPGTTDKQLLALAAQMPPSRVEDNIPRLTMEDVRTHYARVSPDLAYRCVLVVSPDVVNANMAGPGIRCWELARVLGQRFDVTLAVPGTCDLAGEGFEVACYDASRPGPLREAAAEADVVVVSGYVLHEHPFLKEIDAPLVVDLYDPFIIENLHFHARKPLAERMAIHRNDLAVLNDQVQAGDFYLCASEKQRDYWIGLLMANNRVNPQTWDDDPALRALIDVVPFGLRSRPPRADAPRLKGVRPGIGADDQVILWGGGVWEWLDPLTTIRALPRVVEACPRARLLFIGIRHPNPSLPDSRMASRAIELSREEGLLDRYVFFNEWTPYAEREAYLLEADVGISTHVDHLETRYAFRTRLLDYFWAGLPVVTSGGDALSDVVAAEGLGRVVGSEDVEGVADALIELLSMPDAKRRMAPAFARVRAQFAWERVAAPLVTFCQAPRHAVDKASAPVRSAGVIATPEPTPAWRLPARAWRIVKERGLVGLGAESASYVRWLITRL
jgi:glycosyltransferase involved in cell wall biosynthesis